MLFWASLGFFVFSLIFSRYLYARGLKDLNDQQKAAILDAFGSMRMFTVTGLIAVMAFILLVSLTNYFGLILCIYVIVLLGTLIYKLSKLDLPKSFMQKFMIGRGLLIISMALVYLSFNS